MDNNAILKLSNKNKLNLKDNDSPKMQVQTQLVDSITQRMNIVDKTPGLILKSPENSKSNQSKSSNNSKNQERSKSVANSKSPPQTPLSQSKINEIIYYNNYGEPVIEINSVNSNINNQSNPNNNILNKVGTVPIEIDCPFCNNQIQSQTDSKCNGLTACLYFLMIIVFPIMIISFVLRAGTGSNNCIYCISDDGGCCDCCNDVKHTCPKCGKFIAESKSRSRLCSCI